MRRSGTGSRGIRSAVVRPITPRPGGTCPPAASRLWVFSVLGALRLRGTPATCLARPANSSAIRLSDGDGCPTQDFAAVTRAVFTGSPEAVARLTFIGFDVLRGR
jgi:hypothetical protein